MMNSELKEMKNRRENSFKARKMKLRFFKIDGTVTVFKENFAKTKI